MARPLRDLSRGRARPPDGLVAVGPGRPAIGPGHRSVGRPDLHVTGPEREPGRGQGNEPDEPEGPTQIERPDQDAGASVTLEPTPGELDVFGFPVQIGKVQPPLLPAETLERGRLLDWMAAKIHSRLVLIVADAGYGKTTLLADWSRRTRLRVLWYRLDETDRDWVVFVNHVVAAGREIDPDFAPNTVSLLGELGAGMGDRASIVRTLLTEIRRWVTGGTALLLDDYHVIDDVPEVREIVRELALRGPERLAVVVSTRRAPTLPLARLRALGEVAELATADLRFDRGEMEQLFRDMYRHPLEPDLLDDLARTTEGWAATLRLVETAVRGRPREEVRAVITGLSARHGDLHDYLAEEVVGRMPPELQDFLERCSLLHVATPHLAAAAADVSIPDARRLLDDAEEAGLLSRRGRTGQAGRLLHPLVRSFLEGRLQESVGPTGIAEIHVRIAVAAEPNSWWLAGHHYAAAGCHDDVARVLSGSLEAILGSGGAQAAVELITAVGLSDDGGWAKALIARSLLREGDIARAREAASLSLEASARGDPTIPPTVALATLTTVEYNAGEYEAAVEYAGRLRRVTQGTIYSAIAESILAVADSMIDGSLTAAEQVLQTTASLATRLGHAHYVGISYLNLAWLARGAGDPDAALIAAQISLESLASTSAGPEMDTVRTVLAWAHASWGSEEAADREIRLALSSPFTQGRFETLLESSDAVGSFIDPMAGQAFVDQAEAVGARTSAERTYSLLFRAESLNRVGRSGEARTLLDSIPAGTHTGYPGFYVRAKVARAVSAFIGDARDRQGLVAEARAQAQGQEAQGALRTIRLLEALDSDPDTASGSLRAMWSVDPGTVAACAEPVLSRLADLDEAALQAVLGAARQRPRRWILGLRSHVDAGPQRSRWAAGTILEEVGEKADVRRLRALSRELKGQYRAPSMGRSLARRTADRVWIEDQGRVVIRIGDRSIAGSELRRKPLALICYLLSRPGMSATRDQVLEALWPGADPDQAVNSLHQTVYFLRRIIEPSYSDDLSPGYVNQDTELLWLDPELIASRSARCKERMKALGVEPAVEDVLGLAREYRGRFALDFSYEDWAATYRESLHAQYLELMERTIASTTAAARFADAIELTRALLETDPTLDAVQASLVKMYRVVGAHAAAAEQYQVYSSVMRDELGLEPEPLDQL